MRRLIPLEYIHLRLVLFFPILNFSTPGADYILHQRQTPEKKCINYYHVNVFHSLGKV